MRRRSDLVRSIQFGALPQPVRFRGCRELIDAIRTILRGWRVRDVDPASYPAPVIRERETRRGYRIFSCRLNRPSLIRPETCQSLVDALCTFHFEFLDWYLEEHPKTLFVHGAAVMFGRGLVVFPALAKAGKSTLTVRLAMAGRRVFCDDVLPIDTKTSRGLALGIVPRLRPPLPRGAGAEFRRFVRERKGHGHHNRLYVSLKPSELAPLGETAPIGAVVLLTRQKSGVASIRPINPADAMEKIVLQNYAREVPTPLILDTLARVVEGARCYRLRYTKTDDAVALLDETFGKPGTRTSAKRGARADATPWTRAAH